MANLFDKYHEKFKEQIGNEKGRYAFRGQKDARLAIRIFSPQPDKKQRFGLLS